MTTKAITSQSIKANLDTNVFLERLGKHVSMLSELCIEHKCLFTCRGKSTSSRRLLILARRGVSEELEIDCSTLDGRKQLLAWTSGIKATLDILPKENKHLSKGRR